MVYVNEPAPLLESTNCRVAVPAVFRSAENDAGEKLRDGFNAVVVLAVLDTGEVFFSKSIERIAK